MKKYLMTTVLLLAAILVFAAADDRDVVTIKKMPYRVTKKPAVHRTQRADGRTADFSIQGGTAQVVVWSENFDTDLSQWTVNNEVKSGWGPVTVELASTSAKATPFSTIDENDKTSLHIDGDYRVSKRNTAYVTSGDIQIPANARLHAYVGYTEWEECGLYITVSTDDFDTETELWNSKNVDSGWKWREVDADLSAFAGRTVKLRITYGEGTKSNFGVGGYMGDFWVDGLSITGVQTVDQVSVITGEEVHFVDMSTAAPTAWAWTFSGGMPATSADQNPVVYYEQPGTYDVSLTVSYADGGSQSVTKTAFVAVEGQQPVAGVQWPAEFRELQTRMRMVAPRADVTYRDASGGFPTSYMWTFMHESENTGGLITPTVYSTKDYTYNHDKEGKYYVTHIVQNEQGYDFVDDSVQVQRAGTVTNFLPKDGYATNFVDGELTLPGANKMGITAWAEKISKPSVPVEMSSVLVYFTKAAPGEELTNQMASVTFSLYTSENGLPGHSIDLLDSWMMTELNYAMTNNGGVVELELSRSYVIDDEVFIVIDGIPEKADDLECAIAMAPLRSYGNTAYMLNKGTWRPFTGYFQAAPGGQTSLAVFPYFTHQVPELTGVSEVPAGKSRPADGIYDLQGRRLPAGSPLGKGVYIVNGKKYVNQ